MQRADQRLGRDEPYGRRDLPQAVDTAELAGLLHADAHPDVLRPGQVARQPLQPSGPFGEYLVGVPRRRGHHLEHALDEINGDARVEKVAHRIDEYDSRLSPAERQTKVSFVNGNPEAWPGRARITVSLVFR